MKEYIPIIALLVQTLTPYVLAAALGLIVAKRNAIIAFIKAHFTQPQINDALQIATIAVRAVEQLAPALRLTSGAMKATEALARAKEIAKSYGINLSDPQWQGFIESAVRELKASGQELQATATVIVPLTPPAA